MRKVTKKQFVVCKEYKDNVVDVVKGDVVLLQTAEFITDSDPTYTEYLDLCNLESSMTLEVVIFSYEDYRKMVQGSNNWNPKFYHPIDIRELPALFHYAKIQPRNITIEFDD